MRAPFGMGCRPQINPTDKARAVTDSEYARKAYVELRYATAPGSKPMPAWTDLQETERELLVRMFILGAMWASRELVDDARRTNS